MSGPWETNPKVANSHLKVILQEEESKTVTQTDTMAITWKREKAIQNVAGCFSTLLSPIPEFQGIWIYKENWKSYFTKTMKALEVGPNCFGTHKAKLQHHRSHWAPHSCMGHSKITMTPWPYMGAGTGVSGNQPTGSLGETQKQTAAPFMHSLHATQQLQWTEHYPRWGSLKRKESGVIRGAWTANCACSQAYKRWYLRTLGK